MAPCRDAGLDTAPVLSLDAFVRFIQNLRVAKSASGVGIGDNLQELLSATVFAEFHVRRRFAILYPTLTERAMAS